MLFYRISGKFITMTYCDVRFISSLRLLVSRLSKTTCVSLGSSKSATLPPFAVMRFSTSAKLITLFIYLFYEFSKEIGQKGGKGAHEVVIWSLNFGLMSIPCLSAFEGVSR